MHEITGAILTSDKAAACLLFRSEALGSCWCCCIPPPPAPRFPHACNDAPLGRLAAGAQDASSDSKGTSEETSFACWVLPPR